MTLFDQSVKAATLALEKDGGAGSYEANKMLRGIGYALLALAIAVKESKKTKTSSKKSSQ